MEKHIYCEYCGTENTPEASVCVHCGRQPVPEEHLFLDYLKSHTKDELKSKAEETVFETLKGWLMSHLYGMLVTVTVVSSAVASAVSGAGNVRRVSYAETPVSMNEISSEGENGVIRASGAFSGDVLMSSRGPLYWKYDSGSYSSTGAMGDFSRTPDHENLYVCRNNGQEEILFSASGYGKSALLRGRIYFCELEEDGKYYLSCIELNGAYSRSFGEGLIQGTDDRGRYLYYSFSDGSGINVIDTEIDRTMTAASAGRWLAYHGNTVYYSTVSGSTVTLMGMDRDGTNIRKLADADAGGNNGMIAAMHFRNQDVYFSCGTASAGGGMYEGGRVYRLDANGTLHTEAGQNELVEADFTILEDGTVQCRSQAEAEDVFRFEAMKNFTVRNGDIYLKDSVSGAMTMVMSSAEYARAGNTASISEVTAAGDDLWVRIDYMREDSSASVGWRQGYARTGSVLLKKNMKDGRIETVSTY